MRIRYIKPGYFSNEVLASLHPLTRILFAGLWCAADKAGRLEDRPARIKANILPYDNHDIDAALDDLERAGFIIRFTNDHQKLIAVVTWEDHQRPHRHEPESVIPPPSETKKTAISRAKRSGKNAQSTLGLGLGLGLGTGTGREATDSSADADTLPEEALLWNEVAASDFGKVRALNDERRKKLRELRKLLPDLADWRAAIQRLNSWPYAHGKNESGWMAGFDYLISNDKHKNSNLLALSEGAKGGKPQAVFKPGFQEISTKDPLSFIHPRWRWKYSSEDVEAARRQYEADGGDEAVRKEMASANPR